MGQAKKLRAEISTKVKSPVRITVLATLTRVFPTGVRRILRRGAPHLKRSRPGRQDVAFGSCSDPVTR